MPNYRSGRINEEVKREISILLREEVNSGSDLGVYLKQEMDKGKRPTFDCYDFCNRS